MEPTKAFLPPLSLQEVVTRGVKLVPMGLACGDTEHSAGCNCKPGDFPQCKLCSRFSFLKNIKTKKGNHNPNSALANPGPFKERKFPRATLNKPGGPILLAGPLVHIPNGCAGCGGVNAARPKPRRNLLISRLEMEQSLHHSKLVIQRQ